MLEEENVPDHVKSLPDDNDTIIESEDIQKYKQALSRLHNEGEDLHSLEKYKQATMKLLLGKKVAANSS